MVYLNVQEYPPADLSTVLPHHCGGSRIESESGSICGDPVHLLHTVLLAPLWDPDLDQSGHYVEPQHLRIGITSC